MPFLICHSAIYLSIALLPEEKFLISLLGSDPSSLFSPPFPKFSALLPIRGEEASVFFFLLFFLESVFSSLMDRYYYYLVKFKEDFQEKGPEVREFWESRGGKKGG